MRTITTLGLDEQEVMLLKSLLTLGRPLLRDAWEHRAGGEADLLLIDADRVQRDQGDPPSRVRAWLGDRPMPGRNSPFLRKPLRLTPLIDLLNALDASAPDAVAGGKGTGDEGAAGETPFTGMSPDPASPASAPGSTDATGDAALAPATPTHGPGMQAARAARTQTAQNLRLQVPVPNAYHNPEVELDRRRLRQWLEGLPLLDMAESVPELTQRLHLLNQEPLPVRERVRLLEVYRRPIDSLMHAVDSRPRQSTGDRTEEDLGRLLRELASGYKLAVAEGRGEKWVPFGDGSLVLAVHRAMQTLGWQLLHTFRSYAPVPTNLYRETYQLRGHAERHQYLSRRIKDPADQGSIAEGFAQIMLFGVSNPYSLAQGEARAIFDFLGQYANLVRFEPLRASADETTDEGLFCVDLKSDEPPRPRSRRPDPTRRAGTHIMDVRPALSALYGHLQRNGESQGTLLARRLLAHLVAQLRGTNLRDEEREPVAREASVTCGLDAIYGFLVNGNPNASDRWRVANRSAGGFLLTCRAPRIAIRVGDLLAVSDDDPGASTLSVARWLRRLGDGTWQCGAEILAARPVASVCNAPDGSRQPCLLLPRNGSGAGAGGAEASLAAVKGAFGSGATLNIDTPRGRLRVRLTRLVREGAWFDQFELVRGRPPEMAGG